MISEKIAQKSGDYRQSIQSPRRTVYTTPNGSAQNGSGFTPMTPEVSKIATSVADNPQEQLEAGCIQELWSSLPDNQKVEIVATWLKEHLHTPIGQALCVELGITPLLQSPKDDLSSENTPDHAPIDDYIDPDDIDNAFKVVVENLQGKKSRVGRKPTQFWHIRSAFRGKENEEVALTELAKFYFSNNRDPRHAASNAISLLNSRLEETNLGLKIESTMVIGGSSFETYYRFVHCRKRKT